MAQTRWKTLPTLIEPYSYAALRIVTGALFAFHGMQKLFGIYGGNVQTFGTQLWLGGVIELVAGGLIALGLLTRPAAFLSSGTMAVAYIQFHWKFAFADGKWIPTLNMGELAVVFCFLFLFIFAYGPGRFALDLWKPAGRRQSPPPHAPHTARPTSA
ncbi:DoxX family protein [Hyalangium gracile]|uniref:DoxX family protein n=1 Tax=Hyalangium gracile TaxID=394092 RepID=UPI001CCCBF8A|nr:DoxX family protein [Hyalangium gracile]